MTNSHTVVEARGYRSRVPHARENWVRFQNSRICQGTFYPIHPAIHPTLPRLVWPGRAELLGLARCMLAMHASSLDVAGRSFNTSVACFFPAIQEAARACEQQWTETGHEQSLSGSMSMSPPSDADHSAVLVVQ